MATTTIPWGDGSGDNIYLNYPSASGDQTVEVSSDANGGSARSKTITFTAGSLTQTMTVNQEAAVVAIPYIRGGNGAYIDTGLTADNTTRVIVWARNFNPGIGTSGYSWLFGSRDVSLTNQFGVYGCITYNTGKIGGLYADKFFYSGDAFNLMSDYHKYELNGNTLLVDDSVVASSTTATFSNQNTICLFGIKSNGTVLATSNPIDICACKIYKNGILVRDYTPANSPSVGFYDSVTQSLYPNSGSGSFTYGTFNPNAYTRLQYITLTGAQYFNTGVYGSNTLPVICKLRVNGTTVGYTTPFGTMTSNQSGSYYIMQITNPSYPNRYCNFYINTGTARQPYNNNSSRLTNRTIVFYGSATQAGLAENGATIGTVKSFSTSAFTTPNTILLGTTNSAGSPSLAASNMFKGGIYYLGMGSERNYVPALVNGVAGMYDTYNDMFRPSESGTPFDAGPEIQ